MIVSIIAGIMTFAVFTAVISVTAITGYVLLTRNGRARFRARHRQATFVAGLNGISPAPIPNKEIPMRKIIVISGVVLAGIIGIAIANGGSSTAATETPVAQSQARAEAPADLKTEAPAAPVAVKTIATEFPDVVAKGEALHQVQANQRSAMINAGLAVKAQLDDIMNPEKQQASKDANAAFAIANAEVTTASNDYQAAKTAAGSAAYPLTKLDIQFLNAHTALTMATGSSSSQPAADKLMADAQTAWNAAKNTEL